MLARTLRKQLTRSTRSRTGIVQACFQRNINFPVIAPCRGLLYLQPYWHPVEGLRGPWGEGPCGLGSPELSTLPPWQDNTFDSYTLFHLNLSAAPTPHSTGMSYCWTDQSNVCASVFKIVCVCEPERKNTPTKGVCIYTINYRHSHVTLLMTIYIYTCKYLSHGCYTTYMLTFIW